MPNSSTWSIQRFDRYGYSDLLTPPMPTPAGRGWMSQSAIASFDTGAAWMPERLRTSTFMVRSPLSNCTIRAALIVQTNIGPQRVLRHDLLREAFVQSLRDRPPGTKIVPVKLVVRVIGGKQQHFVRPDMLDQPHHRRRI